MRIGISASYFSSSHEPADFVLNVLGEYDDVVHPQASLPLTDLVGSTDKRNLVFPVGHIGVVVSSSAQKKLWPQVGAWLKKHDHVWH